MSSVKIEPGTSTHVEDDDDCRIISVSPVKKTPNRFFSTPSRRDRNDYSAYVNAQVGTPSRRAHAPSPSSRATPSVSRFETPRSGKRGRSRSPARGDSPSSMSKRSRFSSFRSARESTTSSTPNFYDAESGQEDDDDERPVDAGRLVFSPEAASTPAASGGSARKMLSPPVPFPLATSSFASRRRRATTSSSQSSATPPASPLSSWPVIKREPDQSFSTIPFSQSSQRSSQSSSQSQPSSQDRIVRKEGRTYEVNLDGEWTNLYNHCATGPGRPLPILPEKGPRCRKCRNQSTLSEAGEGNKNGNKGRPYYKCNPCGNWITWADLQDCGGKDNRYCRCRQKTRTNICGENSKVPGKINYKCASGNCDFMDWESDYAYEHRMSEYDGSWEAQAVAAAMEEEALYDEPMYDDESE